MAGPWERYAADAPAGDAAPPAAGPWTRYAPAEAAATPMMGTTPADVEAGKAAFPHEGDVWTAPREKPQPGYTWTLPTRPMERFNPARPGPTTQDFIPAELPATVPGQGVVGAMGHAAAAGLETGVGEVAAAPFRMAQGLAGTGRRASTTALATLDQIDAGKPVAPMDDPLGYTDMSPEQRQQTRAQVATVAAAPQGPAEQALSKTASAITQATQREAQTSFPIDPSLQANPFVRAAGMAGGIAPLVVATAIGGLPAATGTAFGQSYVSTYDDAKAHGASDDVAHGAAVRNAAVQAGLMDVPAAQWLGMLTPRVGGALANAAIGAAVHGGTMVGVSQAQTLADNLFARGYDPNRPVSQGLGDDMLAQFALGALIPGVGEAARAVGHGAANLAQDIRRPVVAPELAANVAAQREAAARVQAAPPPQPPAAEPPPPAPPPPADPHQVLDNIAEGKPAAAPRPGSEPPPPSPQGQPAPSAEPLPPAQWEPPPPSPQGQPPDPHTVLADIAEGRPVEEPPPPPPPPIAAPPPVESKPPAPPPSAQEEMQDAGFMPPPPGMTPDHQMAEAVNRMLATGDTNTGLAFSARELQERAKQIYGGSLAEGAFGRDRLYDAQELGVNRFIQDNPKRFDPTADWEKAVTVADDLARLKDKLPTQTVRAGEKDTHQQFSTPPDYAYAAAWAANLKPTDHVLEPSAGTGSLAVHALNAGAKVAVNEISEKRRQMIDALKPDRITQEDATHLHNALPADIKPSVVLMNPPFSAAPGRMGDKMVLQEGARHVQAALDRLEPGGRLVAIVGRGMTMDAPAFKAWWKRIGAGYDVRANVGVGGGIYRKYGTNFGTRLLVIDKVPPRGNAPVQGQVGSAADLIKRLGFIHDDRPSAGEQLAGQPPSPEVAPVGEGAPGPGETVRPPTGGVGPGDGGHQPAATPEPVPAKPPRGGTTGPRPGPRVGGKGRLPGDGDTAVKPEPEPGRPAGEPGAPPEAGPQPPGGSQDSGGSHTRPDGSDLTVAPPNPELVNTNVITPDPETGGELNESVYESYKPQRIAIAGARPHPGPLVQSAAMASVAPPTPTYNAAIPRKLVTSGGLSDAQLESIVYAGEAHSKMLADGGERRKGFFIGDGTGVGKGREVAGIILDNWQQGRKKAIWVSEKMGLAKDATRDWTGLGQSGQQIIPHGKIKAADPIGAKEGILFTTYDTVKSGEKVKASGPTGFAEDQPKGKSRVDQIVDWVGKDFDGVLAFDEAHNMGNAVAIKGKRGITQPAAKALAGVELQQKLPNARVVYVSATGATEVSNLSYADRLGLWGEGTAFPNRGAFINQITSGGVAAMELVARDMKALGHYMARNLSYEGVEYDRLLHPLTPEQRGMYDKIAEGWQVVLQNMMEALEETGQTDAGGAAKKGSQKSGVLSAFWGGHQRFFNQLITSLQMPTVIRGVERDVAEGRQAVLQLVNTNEAGQERALDKARAEGAKMEDLEELDMSPRDQLMQLVQKAFPVHQFEDYVDDDGNIRVRPAKDAEGNPIISKAAVAKREKLLDDLGSLRVPDGPLEILLNHFGPEAVAEVTGRKQRVVNKLDENGAMKRMLEKRGGAANEVDSDAFQGGKKKILVFSQAGGTGRSYHADNASASAGARRSHYLVQAGWRADTAVQGFGRTHRTNQGSAPVFHLVTTDLEGQKRFISSIARRLGQLGALTKGERRTGDQGLFGLQDNLESDEAKAALIQFYRDVVGGKIAGVTADNMAEHMGLHLIDPTTGGGGLRSDPPPMTQFLNRILSLQVDAQNHVFNEFATRFRDVVQHATEAGTLDAGVETYKADRITKQAERTVYTDPESGAQTKYVRLETHNRNFPTSFEDIHGGKSGKTGWIDPDFYVLNTKGDVASVTLSTHTTTTADGITTEYYRIGTPLTTSLIPQGKVTRAIADGNYQRIDDPRTAKKLWDQRVAAAPPFKTEPLHLITGAVLPIWDRLAGKPKIYRLQTDTGETMLGRVIDKTSIGATLDRLGASEAFKTSPAETIKTILEERQTARLANGWTIKPSLVAGEWRMELKGPDLYAHTPLLEKAGVFRERIAYDTRYFIPTGETGEAAIAAITKTRPVVSFGEGGGARDTGGPEDLYARRAGPAGQVPQEAMQARQDLYRAAKDMMRFVGLSPRVGLKFVDQIIEAPADAKYARGMITYALDTAPADAPLKILHEAIHAMVDPALGLVTPKERLALYAGADRWLKADPARAAELRRVGYNSSQLRDEAVARMGEQALQRGLAPTSLVATVFNRMRNFAQGIGQALRGEGYTTADDVLRGMLRGERAPPGAMRGVPTMAPPAAPQAPPQPEEAPAPEAAARESPQPPQTSAPRTPLDAEFPPEAARSTSDVLAEQQAEQYALRSANPVVLAKGAADDVQRLFSPTTRSDEARRTELTIRGRAAKQAQSAAQSGHALEQFRHMVGRLTPDQQIDITDRIETGQRQADPALQPVANELRRQLDLWRDKIRSLGTGKLEQARDNYMGRIWANYDEWAAGQPAPPGAALTGLSQAVGAGIGKRPIRGSGNFLKARTFETLRDGMAAGLVPVTTNPIEMQTLKLREMQKYYHGTKLADELKQQGLARWVPTEGYTRAAQLGLAPLDDRIFTPKVPADPHGLLEHGKWMAPEPAARVFNNYVSQGWSGHSTIYDAVRQAGNLLNSVQLGFSGFHATFISLDTMISRVALGLQQISHGDVGRGIVNTALGLSPTTVAQTVARGSKLRSAYLDPQAATPEWRRLADALNAGGGRINMDQFYRSSAAGPFFRNMRDLANPDGAFREAAQMVRDTPLSAPFKIAGRVMDSVMEPLMGQLVPRAKLGVFADLAADWQRRNPAATPEQVSKAMTGFWDSVDNRMGQLVYDNLFWSKALKDSAFISTRSVGWNLGTLRELGGAGVDTARQVNAMLHGQAPELTTRMAYAMAMPILSATLGALLTYAYTGHGPQQTLDYFYPPTGKMGPGGEQRVSIPGYIKDVVAYTHAPVETVANKLHPLASMTTQLVNNRDYYGGSIYDPRRDNPMIAYSEYLLNQTLPFTVRAMMRNAAAPEPATMLEQTLAFWGVQPAPGSIVNPARAEANRQRADVAAYKRRLREQGRISISP